MRKEPVFKCPKCGAKPTELIEVGVNVDVFNLKGEILFPVGEQAGFFFCPKCDGEISRELGWDCDLSSTEREKEAVGDRDVFRCPSCGVELKHLIRVGVYRDVLWSGGFLDCLDDKLRLVICPECKANITVGWRSWLVDKRSKLDALSSLAALFKQPSAER